MLKFGAIDIGSNAVRLLITSVFEGSSGPIFKKTSLVRVPIRLGADVFTSGTISEENCKRMVDAMSAFQLLLGVHGVVGYRACATSAMRNSTNGEELSERTRRGRNDIEIIKERKKRTSSSPTILKRRFQTVATST